MSKFTDTEWRRALRGEPQLPDVMADPIIGMLMARDGVSRDELRSLIERVRRSL